MGKAREDRFAIHQSDRHSLFSPKLAADPQIFDIQFSPWLVIAWRIKLDLQL
jgi:hypothetical protein